MKINFRGLLILLFFLITPVIILATQEKNQINQNNAVSNQGESQQVQSEMQVQTQTNNSDSSEEVQVQTQEQIQERKEVQNQIQESKPEYSPRNETARQHMSAVAAAVESLIKFAARIEDEGIGDQIREIARLQGESEDKVNQSFDEVQKRSTIVKFFIGPDFSELKKVKEEIEQNQLRIQELQRIVFKLQNQKEKIALQNQIEILESQKISLQDALEEEEEGFSLLGWFFKWLAKY